jgi:hypothetical protein
MSYIELLYSGTVRLPNRYQTPHLVGEEICSVRHETGWLTSISLFVVEVPEYCPPGPPTYLSASWDLVPPRIFYLYYSFLEMSRPLFGRTGTSIARAGICYESASIEIYN